MPTACRRGPAHALGRPGRLRPQRCLSATNAVERPRPAGGVKRASSWRDPFGPPCVGERQQKPAVPPPDGARRAEREGSAYWAGGRPKGNVPSCCKRDRLGSLALARMAAAAAATAATGPLRRVCVVGAGVVGLTTALRLLQAAGGPGRLALTVVASGTGPDTTSAGAAGVWGPYRLSNTPDVSAPRSPPLSSGCGPPPPRLDFPCNLSAHPICSTRDVCAYVSLDRAATHTRTHTCPPPRPRMPHTPHADASS